MTDSKKIEIPEDLREWRQYLADGEDGMSLEEEAQLLDLAIEQKDAIATLTAERDKDRAELALVDEALARRPAVADSPNRYTAICAAFNMATRTDKSERMEKHWKFHYEKTVAERDEALREVEYYKNEAKLNAEGLSQFRAKIERLKAPVSDELIHEFYSGECEAGISFDFLRRFQVFIANRAKPQKERE